RELVEPARAAELAAAGPDTGHDLRLVARAQATQLDASAEVRREGIAQLGEFRVGRPAPGGIYRVEDRERRTIELPIGAEDLDRDRSRASHLGCNDRSVGVHALALVDLEHIAHGGLAYDRSEWRVDLHEWRVGRQDLDP